MFSNFIVVGRNSDGTTAYRHSSFHATQDEAIDAAIDERHNTEGPKCNTVDVFRDGTRTARVHPDGGIDFIKEN